MGRRAVLACLTMGLGLACSDSSNRLTVMTFNIRHDADWADRSRLVISTIQRARADVVAVQEAYLWQAEEIVAEIPEYAFVGRGRDPDGAGESVSILYRRDRFEADTSGTFWFSDQPEVPGSRAGVEWGDPTLPRIGTWVRLTRRSTPQSFYVYNVHLQHDAGSDPELTRVRSVLLLREHIRDHVRGDPAVLAGDFNAAPTSIPIRYLVEAERSPIRYCSASGARPCEELRNPTPMIDAWHHLFPESGAGTYPCANADRRIDYVFVSPPGRPVGARIEAGPGACASDHLAVIVELILSPRVEAAGPTPDR